MSVLGMLSRLPILYLVLVFNEHSLGIGISGLSFNKSSEGTEHDDQAVVSFLLSRDADEKHHTQVTRNNNTSSGSLVRMMKKLWIYFTTMTIGEFPPSVSIWHLI